MKIEQIYTGCLAQGAYYIESEGEVAIIDPLREVSPYIKKAEAANATIKYIFETHFHADFVSGHVTLSEKTNAPIIYGPTANPTFKAYIATDSEVFQLGKLTITALHTPGHTMESTTYLLKDENGDDHALFTGDTLFLGDVGRPDLAQKAANMTQDDLAGLLYDSLRTKIMPLADSITVYPAHGAGSACGKNMMKETVDTLGNQRKMNYALRADMTKAEFVAEVTDGLLPPPAYFPENVRLNKEGYSDFDIILEKGSNGSFAPWVGELIVDVKQPILLVAPEGKEEEAVTRLSRVGFDNTLGYLEGGIEAWEAAGKETDSIMSIPATEFKEKIADTKSLVFDVRKESEFAANHVEDAKNTPLSNLNNYLAAFPKEQNFYLHCLGGYRSIIAASILKSRGYHNLIDVQGGFRAIEETGVPVTDFVCPSTLKK
jgi:glyoxylase-like metal-dependent hydrolase (beta-lactamase superfamily II)/rhodanese-related sulfurtransferase